LCNFIDLSLVFASAESKKRLLDSDRIMILKNIVFFLGHQKKTPDGTDTTPVSKYELLYPFKKINREKFEDQTLDSTILHSPIVDLVMKEAQLHRKYLYCFRSFRFVGREGNLVSRDMI